jgi:hypothetical protein
MPTHCRRCHPLFSACVSLLLLFSVVGPAWSAEKTRLRVDDYKIEAELNPHAQQ